MSEDTTVALQSLLDRLREGDRQAGRLLLERAHERLRQLAGRILFYSFPALQARHDPDSLPHEQTISTPPRAPPKPLLVDDDELLRLSLGRRFERQGLAVTTAASGAEALERATAVPPMSPC
jgi:hypothetical protein